ncbi:MAG: hypothetical protein AB8G18_11710 [Gammaproteobacteria bacterium]
MHNRFQDSLKPHLPLLVFLLPVISINLAYIVASLLDHIPRCIPYLSGCTSISSAGRIMPQKGIFLVGMVPAAIFALQLWTHSEAWLTQNSERETSRALVLTGALASFCLLIYVTTLGIPGDVYRLFRKFGVLLYFGCTFIAQLLLVKELKRIGSENDLPHYSKLAKRLEVLCTLVLLCGLVIIPISLIEDPIKQKQFENVVEWNYAFVLHIYYLALYPTWLRAARPRSNPELTHGY